MSKIDALYYLSEWLKTHDLPVVDAVVIMDGNDAWTFRGLLSIAYDLKLE
jgi:hypothetical protein